jgi:diguanylate cyclase (GGDEF)-like protein/PAS domain S-box-containing protein
MPAAPAKNRHLTDLTRTSWCSPGGPRLRANSAMRVAAAAGTSFSAALTGSACAATGASAAPDAFLLGSPVGLIGLTIGCLLMLGCGVALLYQRLQRATGEPGRIEALFDVLDEGIVICQGMQVIAVNSSLCRLLGSEPHTLSGGMISSFLRDPDVIDALLSERDVDLETELYDSNGAAIPVEMTARAMQHAGAPRRIMEVRDIRERKANQEHISFLAHYDPLTGLPNREMLRARLGEAVTRAADCGHRCALIWVGLDRFKEINDVYGHTSGDRSLRDVADKLRFELPADVLISRFGGDEFVILYDQISDPAEARLIGQQLRRLLNRPLQLGEHGMVVGASVGLAVFPDDANCAEDLLKNADLALQHAKAEGRGRCRVFTDEMGLERQRRTTLGEQLKDAVENGEVQAYFQPLVRTTDGKIVGFEALGRWFHPEFGAVPPPEFIRIAEESGLIGSVTDSILRQAIAAAQTWPADVRISVNVSPVQINSDLVDRVRNIVTACNFDPRRLELEVTEDVLIKDFEQTASMFGRLRALGVQVAMDDFGAGYTSLGNLRRLNFDRIKIDRIFTIDLPNHRRSAAIVRAIFVLARQLELDVTVEGVETEEQLAFLRAEGCFEVQGYLFSKPKPLSAFKDVGSLRLGPMPPDSPPVHAPATLVAIDELRRRA